MSSEHMHSWTLVAQNWRGEEWTCRGCSTKWTPSPVTTLPPPPTPKLCYRPGVQWPHPPHQWDGWPDDIDQRQPWQLVSYHCNGAPITHSYAQPVSAPTVLEDVRRAIEKINNRPIIACHDDAARDRLRDSLGPNADLVGWVVTDVVPTGSIIVVDPSRALRFEPS